MVSGTFTIPFDHLACEQQLAGCDHAFTLPRYIGGQENALARWSVAQLGIKPLRANPLTFFGPGSVGKSTLLCGIEQSWKNSLKPEVLLTNGADFFRGYAYAIETGAVPDFRDKHLRQGLLVVDDLQLLARKTAAQQEFLNLLDLRVKTAAPVVVSLDASLTEQHGLNDALVSRLAGGLVVRLQPPTSTTRRVILDQLLDQANLVFPAVVRETICGQRLGTESPFVTVPEIRHAIIQLQHRAEENGAAPSLLDTIELIDKELAARKPTVSAIIKRVARYFKLKTRDLKSGSRRQFVVRARGVAFYLARQLTGRSFKQLGRALGGRDHSTVIHACRRTESLLKTDPAVGVAIMRLRWELEGENGGRAGEPELQCSYNES